MDGCYIPSELSVDVIENGIILAVEKKHNVAAAGNAG